MGLFDLFKSSGAKPQPIQADKIDLSRPDYRSGCGRVHDGIYHLQHAREAVRAGNADFARLSYQKAAESWRQANETECGKWQQELEQANKEYGAFVQSDPLYKNGLAVLLPIIKDNPGILQTDMYKKCSELERESISYILYFAASAGVIERVKKGRTYEITAK